ncbi:GntR family transcriptional regulator [Virgibacillus sp. W0181]|uniref:GntR family transcriptional regulator n=1 Tax=Virgibacillus sp. W0181 TaxID=3391581 RepID=UPI003F47DC7D
MRKIVQSESLADQAYNLIKKEIITGKLLDNEPLPEEKLAKNLGISRTPLRDALRRLAMEGLIVPQKGKPSLVATFTREDSLEFMEIRSILEIDNIVKIMSAIDDLFVDQLKENVDEQLEAVEQDNFQQFIELDREFHLLLASKNKNGKFREMIHQMNTGVNRAFLILSNTITTSAKEACEEHMEIIKALDTRDVHLAKKKMTVHLDNVERRFLSYFSKEDKTNEEI